MRFYEVRSEHKAEISAFSVALLFTYAFVGWSVLFPVAGVPRTLITGIVTVGALLMAVSRSKVRQQWLLMAIALISLTALIHTLYWMNPSNLRLVWSFCLALVLVAYARDREIDRLIDIATAFVSLMLLGAVIAQIYTMAGGGPWGGFDRPGQEEVRMLVLPFSLAIEAKFDGSVRVTGIYDEPGAFSFVICLLAFLRRARGKSPAMTWALLGFGAITLSLAHLVFIACFMLSGNLTRMGIIIGGVVVATVTAGLVATPAGDALVEQVGSRILGEEIEGRLVRGDNRSERFALAVDTMVASTGSVLIGTSSIDDRESFKMMGENPLTPLARYGIVASWPYYAYLIFGAVCLFRGRQNLSFFGIVLLLAQRPYVQSDGYSLLAVLALWAQIGGFVSRDRLLPNYVGRGSKSAWGNKSRSTCSASGD